MAKYYSYDKDWLKNYKPRQVKAATPQFQLPKGQTAQSARARANYTKQLGFKPKDMPEFRSENPYSKKGITGKVFDLLDRARSGFAMATQNEFVDRNRELYKPGQNTMENRFKFGLGNFVRTNPVTAPFYLGDDIWRGMTGEVNVTGRSNISRMFDDPNVRRTLSPTTKRFVDNNYVRGAGGLLMDISGDPLNAIPLSVAAKPITYGSKALGITDNIAKPLYTAIKQTPVVERSIKILGGMRPKIFSEAVGNKGVSEAIGSEFAKVGKKMLEKPLSAREYATARASLAGVVKRLGDPEDVSRALNVFDNAYAQAEPVLQKFAQAGKEVDQKKLYEYMTKVIPKNADQDYLKLAGLGRAVQDDILAPLLVKTGKVDPETIAKGSGEYMRKIYKQGGKVTDEPAFIQRAGGAKLGAERGILEEAKSDATRVLEYIRNNPNPKYNDIVGRFNLLSRAEELLKYPKKGLIPDPDGIVRTGLRTTPLLDEIVGTKGGRIILTNKTLKHILNERKGAFDYLEVLPDIINSPDTIRRKAGDLSRTYLSKDIAVSRSSPITTVILELRNTRDGLVVTIMPNKEKYFKGYDLLWRTPKVNKLPVSPSDSASLQKLSGSRGANISALTIDNIPQKPINIIPDLRGDAKHLNKVSERILPKIKELLGEDYRRLALQQRRAEGLIDDASTIFSIGTEQGINLVAKQKLFDDTLQFAKDFTNEASMAAEGFKRIPDTELYGNLAGKAVPDVIYDDIVGIIDPSNKEFRKIVNAWKQLKLFSPLQFASVARNQMGDMILNSMVDGGPSIAKQLRLLPKAIMEYNTGGKLYKELMEEGVFASTFANQEARKLLFDELGRAADPTLATRIGQGADWFTSKSFNSKIPGVGYGKESFSYTSDINKMTQIMHQMENGKSLKEAIEMSAKATFDYSRLPASLRKYRDSIMPFMTFKYFATQLMIDTLINRTGKISKVGHSVRNIESLTADKANEQDLPDYIKENRQFHVRTPFNDSAGNPRYLDLSYIYPMGDTDSTSIQDIALGNPFLRTGAELLTNRDTFMGTEIFKNTDSGSDRARKTAFYLLSQFGPNAPYMPDKRGRNALLESARGQVNSQGNDPQFAYDALARFGGIRLREINPDQQAKWNAWDKKDKRKEIESTIRSIQRDQNLSSDEKKKRIEKEKDKIRNL